MPLVREGPRIRNICVLISGSGAPRFTSSNNKTSEEGKGTNLQAIIDAIRSDPPSIHEARIGLVISNRKNAYGLTRASEAGIPNEVMALKPFLDKHPGAARREYDLALASRIRQEQPDLVVFAGFMHIVSDAFLAELQGHPEEDLNPARFKVPIINLHPALPGAFDGIHAIQRAHEAFQKGEIDRTGVMIHYVVAEVDRGAPVVVQEVEMKKGETVEELEARIHQVEHELIVRGVRQVLDTPKPVRLLFTHLENQTERAQIMVIGSPP